MSYSNTQIAAYVKGIEDKYKQQLKQQEAGYQARISDAENSRNTAITAAQAAKQEAQAATSKLSAMWGKISAMFGITDPNLSELEKTARQYSAWTTKVPALQQELENARQDFKSLKGDSNDLEKAYQKLMRAMGGKNTDGTGGAQSPSLYASLLGAGNSSGGLSGGLLDALNADVEAQKTAAAATPAPPLWPKLLMLVLLSLAIWYGYKYFKG